MAESASALNGGSSSDDGAPRLPQLPMRHVAQEQHCPAADGCGSSQSTDAGAARPSLSTLAFADAARSNVAITADGRAGGASGGDGAAAATAAADTSCLGHGLDVDQDVTVLVPRLTKRARFSFVARVVVAAHGDLAWT